MITAPLIAVLPLLALPAAPASAASWQSCGSSRTTIGNQSYVMAIKIKAKGASCATIKDFWIHYATGEAGDAFVEDLRAHCKEGSKKQQNAAAKKSRYAYSCRSADGKVMTTAWVLGG